VIGAVDDCAARDGTINKEAKKQETSFETERDIRKLLDSLDEGAEADLSPAEGVTISAVSV
jgi:hypothetical protein